jgi:hypothetical protein
MDFLGIVGALLASLWRSRASHDAEILFLRQQLIEAFGPGSRQIVEDGQADFRLAIPVVPVPARGRGYLQTGDAGALASGRSRCLYVHPKHALDMGSGHG